MQQLHSNPLYPLEFIFTYRKHDDISHRFKLVNLILFFFLCEIITEVSPTMFDKLLTAFYYLQFKVTSLFHVSNVFHGYLFHL